jgi:hypothetical protein
VRFVHPVADAFGICLGERCACGKSHVPFRRGSEKISWERQISLRVIPPARTKTTTGVDHARSSCAVSDWRSRGAWWRLYHLSPGALTHARLSSGSRDGGPASEMTSGFRNCGALQHGRTKLVPAEHRLEPQSAATNSEWAATSLLRRRQRTLGLANHLKSTLRSLQCGWRVPIHQMREARTRAPGLRPRLRSSGLRPLPPIPPRIENLRFTKR